MRRDRTDSEVSVTRTGVFALLSALLLLSCIGCNGDPDLAKVPASPRDGFVVRGARGLDGETFTFGVVAERIVDPSELSSSAPVVDLGGRFTVPAFIDSHVHLTYYAVAEALPAGGIVAAADFAAPIESLGHEWSIPVRRSGPMLTPLAGYPTTSWGAGGYGLEVTSESEARAAVDRLLDAGADFIKAPLMGTSGLSDELLGAVIERAHERQAKVAVHALTAEDAARAVASSVDILAHTPAEPVAAEVLAGWGARAVVSTLSAFGASASAVSNLSALRDAGARVLYGTDLGNTRTVGIQAAEVDALVAAGFSGSEIVRSATAQAAEFWGFSELGTLEPGKRASFLVLSDSPDENPGTLAVPLAVVFDGRVVAGALP
jgi:imidazolonepropionase-like amidohydrolase